MAPLRVFSCCIQLFAVGVAVVFCFRGNGQHLWWVLLASLVPAAQVLLSRNYRQWLFGAVTRLWASARAYPNGRRDVPWLATVILIVLPTTVLCLSGNHGIVAGDTRPVVLTAASLVNNGNLDLTWYFAEIARQEHRAIEAVVGTHGWVQFTPTGIHSSYPSGMVVFALPVVAAARLLRADLAEPQVHWRLEKWTASWVAGLCLGVFFLLALHLVDAAPAYVAAMLLATGSVVFSTVGQGLWQHGGVILWGLTALLLEFRQGYRPSARTAAAQGLVLGQMLACRLSAALFILPFGIWILMRSPRRALAIGAFSLLGYAPWALLYWSVYGNPFGPSTGQMAATCWSQTVWRQFVAVLVSPGRGVLIYQPWILLVALGVVPYVARRGREEVRSPRPAGWASFCIVFVVLHLALVSAWGCWWGGSCWGSRLAAETVPVIALLCLRPIAALWSTKAGRIAVGTLALASFLVHAPGVYLNGEKWNYTSTAAQMWSWSDPPFLYPFLHGSGR